MIYYCDVCKTPIENEEKTSKLSIQIGESMLTGDRVIRYDCVCTACLDEILKTTAKLKNQIQFDHQQFIKREYFDVKNMEWRSFDGECDEM